MVARKCRVHAGFNRRAFPKILTFAVFGLFFCAMLLVGPMPGRADDAQNVSRADRVMSKLQTSLNLTAEQAATIRPLIEDSMQQHRALRNAFHALHEGTDAKISALLTADQLTAYQALKQERRQKMISRMQKGNGPSGAQ